MQLTQLGGKNFDSPYLSSPGVNLILYVLNDTYDMKKALLRLMSTRNPPKIYIHSGRPFIF